MNNWWIKYILDDIVIITHVSVKVYGPQPLSFTESDFYHYIFEYKSYDAPYCRMELERREQCAAISDFDLSIHVTQGMLLKPMSSTWCQDKF